MWTKLIKSTCMPTISQDAIYIQADIDAAETIFTNRFGFNPLEDKCGCCGAAYTPKGEYVSLQHATSAERGCRIFIDSSGAISEEPLIWGGGLLSKYRTLSEYLSEDDLCVIQESHISCEDLEIDATYRGYEFDIEGEYVEGEW